LEGSGGTPRRRRREAQPTLDEVAPTPAPEPQANPEATLSQLLLPEPPLPRVAVRGRPVPSPIALLDLQTYIENHIMKKAEEEISTLIQSFVPIETKTTETTPQPPIAPSQDKKETPPLPFHHLHEYSSHQKCQKLRELVIWSL